MEQMFKGISRVILVMFLFGFILSNTCFANTAVRYMHAPGPYFFPYEDLTAYKQNWLKKIKPRIVFKCTPERIFENKELIEKRLDKLATSYNFRNAKHFKAQVAAVKKLQTIEEKYREYLKWVNVKYENENEVDYFLEAPDLTEYVKPVEKNLNLTRAQVRLFFVCLCAEKEIIPGYFLSTTEF